MIENRQLFRRDGLLGTVVDVTIAGADSDHRAARTAFECFDEIDRLQRVFNTYDDVSELRRWQRGEVEPGPELAAVNELAAEWRRRSGGAFDPAIGGLMASWDRASSAARCPSRNDVAQSLEDMHGDPLRYWNLNAIAKGWIVDRAAHQAFRIGEMAGLTINAGGDLRSVGSAETVVGIENPRRPYDNVPPLTRVRLGGAALATSGNTRRGWSIDGVWHGHVIDPRTGWPVAHVESASVIAADAATADVVATILTVLPVSEGLKFADRFEVACLIFDAAGNAHRNRDWRSAEVAVAARGATPRVHSATSQAPSVR